MRSMFRVADYVAPENADLTAALLNYSRRVAVPRSHITYGLCSMFLREAITKNFKDVWPFRQECLNAIRGKVSQAYPVEEHLLLSRGSGLSVDLHMACEDLYRRTMHGVPDESSSDFDGRRLRAWWAHNLAVVASRRPVPNDEGEPT